MLFIIDTGVYLTLTFMTYNILWLLGPPATTRPNALLPRLTLSVSAFLVGALVLISGLYVASGSSLFSPGFARQWLEVLWIYPEGVSMLPMIQSEIGVIMSYWVIILYLGTVIAGLPAVQGRSPRY